MLVSFSFLTFIPSHTWYTVIFMQLHSVFSDARGLLLPSHCAGSHSRKTLDKYPSVAGSHQWKVRKYLYYFFGEFETSAYTSIAPFIGNEPSDSSAHFPPQEIKTQCKTWWKEILILLSDWLPCGSGYCFRLSPVVGGWIVICDILCKRA